MTRFPYLTASFLIMAPALIAWRCQELHAQSSRTEAIIATMKADLRGLMTSQEAYFSDHATYATNVGGDAKTGSAIFRTGEGNTAIISNADQHGWTALVTNVRIPAEAATCGVFVGPRRNQPSAVTWEEGVPACWGTEVQGSGHTLSEAEVDTAVIRLQLDSIAAAWNAADLDGHVAIYSDSATMMGGRGLIRGKPAIRAGLERTFWRDGKPLQQLRFEEVEVRLVGSGEVAIVTGKFVLFGGDKPETSGRFSTIWVKENGKWLTVHDHSS
jgi:uncharacterized protein (TIGR02246 family)